MSSKAGSTVATALVSAPLGALAMMAVFGIPQFTAVVASPEAEEVPFEEMVPEGEGSQRRPRPADDLFRDYNAEEGRYRDPRDAGGNDRFPPPDRTGTASADPFASGRGQGIHGQGQYADGGAAGGVRQGGPGEAGFAAANNRAALDVDAAQAGWPNSGSRGVPPAGGATSQPQRQPVTESRPMERQPATAGSSLTWKQAVRELNELGIDTYHLERGSQPETFLFVCLFSPGDDPRVTQRFEAEASEPLDAVANVLRQIEQWLQRRFGESRQTIPMPFPSQQPR
ncbi:hypothetical protein Mal4_11660 [Maioricimonas rarisocia]|uniref:Uncharacterized protein n=1 Tax=Maioricimonas rarisocia TaxID=2528026 RepID=A0A517Z314_9PLAN|nr:hypothetical protein [Maioricimonas rarisocia]QDU36865.1 hypothetical protein Mal4_11660 [Maioricimonas rarisocia]